MLLHGRLQFGQTLGVGFAGHLHDRRRHANPRGVLGRCPLLREAVEGVEQRVVVVLGERVVLVIVALRAGHREPQPGGAGRVDAVEEVVEPLLLGDRAPLAIQQVVAVEATGDLLGGGRLGQKVARELLGRELVEWHVVVESLHHPVAPDPLPGIAVLLKAVGVGVAGSVEPGQRHPLAIVLAGEEPVDHLLVGVGRGVGHERIDLLRRGRDPDEIGVESSQERRPVSLGRGRDTSFLEFREHEPIDVVAWPGGVPHGGRGGPSRGHVGPVRLIDRPCANPVVERRLLLLRQPPVGVRWRHQHIGVGRMDPLQQRTRARLAGHDRSGLNGSAAVVEPKAGLPLRGVLAVAVEAVFREDRPDVAVEVDRRLGRGACGGPDRNEHRDGSTGSHEFLASHRSILASSMRPPERWVWAAERNEVAPRARESLAGMVSV